MYLSSSQCRVRVRAFALLAVLMVSTQAPAQDRGRKLEIRAGEGWSMTVPSIRSFVLAIPSHRLDEVTTPVGVYIHRSVTILDYRTSLQWSAGITPMVLFEFMKESPRISLEGGIGANLISTKEIGGRRLGSNFLFSPTISAGIEMPLLNNVVGVFYTFKHLSNAGFFTDNDGVNFQYIIFSMTFD